MAGVAPQQRGGSNATTIGMVVAIVLAVLFLAALIWMFIQQEDLKRAADQATAARARMAASGDENAARQMFPDAAGAGKTLIGEMNKGISALCARLSGDPGSTPQIALGKLDTVLQTIADEGKIAKPELVSATGGAATIIESLYRLYVDELDASGRATEDLARANAKLDEKSQAFIQLDSTFQQELNKLKTQVESLQTAKTEFERVKSGEVEALAQQISEKQESLNSMRVARSELVNTFREEYGRLEGLLGEQREALKELRGPGAQGAQELALARKPIGRVLRALPGDSLVHIDLGRRDNVTLGMTFSVYSADERVPADGRGKANIEVVSLGERTAECRVTTPPSPDDPILEGDAVGNIILSRNKAKKPQFCIVGEFDVDYDGHVDLRGREAIAALVHRYGGEVVDEVTAFTDYVVLGLEPSGTAYPMPAAAESRAPAEAAGAAEEAEESEADEDETEAADEEGDEEEEADDETAGDEDETEAADEEGTEEEEADDEEAGGEEADDDEAGDAEASDEEAGEDEEADEDEAEEVDESDAAKDESTNEEDAADKEDAGDEEEEATEDDEAEEADDEAAQEGEEEEVAAATGTPAERRGSVLYAPPQTAMQIERPREVDPTKLPRARRLLSERERYDLAVRRAEMFSIPRLPQDRFLNFVGIEPGPSAARRLQP